MNVCMHAVGLSTGALAGIIIGAVLIVILVVISISAVIIIIRRGKKRLVSKLMHA